jgi:hypothetical protein
MDRRRAMALLAGATAAGLTLAQEKIHRIGVLYHRSRNEAEPVRTIR